MPAKDIKPKEPVSSQAVYQALVGAASQDVTTVKASSQTLEGFLDLPGTYDQLHSIAAEKNNIPLDVRRMAIIQFKNKAHMWRNKRLFTDDNRVNIRMRSMTFLREEDNIIADCNALIIAKIARTDFPTQWSSLISDLTAALQVGMQTFLSNPTRADPANPLFLKRTLCVLNKVIKEFCSIKMPSGIHTMAQLADALYSPLISYYDRLSGLLRVSLTPEALVDPLLQRTCKEVVELSHLVFKPCEKIMVWLWHRAGQPAFSAALEMLSAFAQSCFQLARGFFDLRVQLVLALRRDPSVMHGAISSSTDSPTIPPQAIETIQQLTRHLCLYGKMFRRIQRIDVRRFIALPQANEMVQYYWGEVVKATNGPSGFIADSSDAVFPTKLLVQGMVLFKNSLSAWSGKGKSANTNEILSEQFVREAVEILLTRFIPLAPTDLEKWMADPEEWANEEEKEGDAWEFDIRPCSERVLLTLCNHYDAYVVPLLLKVFEEVIASKLDNQTSILQKEAIYCAIGRCANQLQNKLDFDSWLQKHLIFEAHSSNPDHRVIKRRIAWVIGRWHSGQCTSRSKTQVWKILHHLMRDRGPGSDPVVRFSAAGAVGECVDVPDFELQNFLPFLRDFAAELLRLVVEADTMESKIRIVKTLNIVIERAGINIVPFMSVVTSPLPLLWQDATEDYLLKANLIVTMTNLVQAAKEHSSSISHMVISLVQECFDPKMRLHLDGDGLALWQAALRNARTLASSGNDSPTYIDMFPHAMVLVSENLDLLSTVISIVQSYMVLDAPRVLSLYGRELFKAFVAAISKALQTNVKEVILTVNLITQIAPAALWAEPMHSSGLFSALVKAVIEDKASAYVLTEHIYVFARIAISDPFVLNQLVVASAPALNMAETEVFEGLLDQWWSKFDHIAESRHRKLVSMGIANWVSTARPEVLGRLHTEIFSLWLDVFGELKEALAETRDEGTRSPLTMFWLNTEQPPEPSNDEQSTLEDERWRQIKLRDPVITSKLTVFVKAQLQQAEIACGGAQAFRTNFLNKADPTVLSQLSTELMSGN